MKTVAHSNPVHRLKKTPTARALMVLLLSASSYTATSNVEAQTTSPSSSRNPESNGWNVSGSVSVGVGVRISDIEPSFVDGRNAAVIGQPSANRTGRNADDGNLNYSKGDVFSAPLKGNIRFQYKQDDWALNARVQAWTDRALHESVPFGHSPNGYVPNTPLTDSGARARAKFDNVIISGASFSRDTRIGSTPTSMELGLVNLGWMGVAPGGALAVLDPLDLAAQIRPGALPEETRISIPALKLRFRPTKDVSVDAFYQFQFVPNQDPLCGTFASLGDRTRDSCVIGLANAPTSLASDGAAIAAGTVNYAVSQLNEPTGGGGLGLMSRWLLPEYKAELVGALVRYDSRRLYNSWIRGTITDTLVANGLARNPYPVVEYPQGIDMLVLGARMEAVGASWYAEWALRRNSPLSFPLGDMFQTFTTATPPTFLRARRDATARGGRFQGWDTYTTQDLNLGVDKVMLNVAGASRINLRASVASRLVNGLPDPNELRYSRPEIFGNLQYPSTAPCTAPNPALTCTTDGFTTSYAWGYSLGAQALYPKVGGSVDIRPSLTIKHDVSGWSWDQSISEGSKTGTLSTDAIFGRYTINGTVVRRWGGVYFPLRDRSYAQVSLAVRF